MWFKYNSVQKVSVKVLFPPILPSFDTPTPWGITIVPCVSLQNFLCHLPVFLSANTNTYVSCLPFHTKVEYYLFCLYLAFPHH